MEETYKERIRQNLSQLVESTFCSVSFLTVFSSRSIFSKIDVQQIETEGKNNGQIAAAKKLYDLLEQRSGSFDVLIDALTETKQSRAIDILSVTPESNTLNKQQAPLKFHHKTPKYIDEYVKEPDGKYLIVCSQDCALTCKRILESSPTCKLYSIKDVLKILSMSPASLEQNTILLVNLENNLDPIHTIEQPTELKTILVTGISEDQLKQMSLPTDLWNVVDDRIQWCHLSSFTKHEIITGLKQSLGLDGKLLTNGLKNIDSKTLVDLLSNKFPGPENLFLNTIPSLMSYYVTRTLQTRYVITREILEEKLDNDFVLFSGIDRHVLTNMCKSKSYGTSSDLLRNRMSVSNFDVLENDMDFRSICEMFPTNPVHLLNFERDEFLWKKSRGSISTIQKFVATTQRDIKQPDFISSILAQNNSSPVCITDTPGKGKSTLLAKLALEVKKHYETGIVAFIPVKELLQRFKDSDISKKSTKKTLAVSSFISVSTLGHAYLEVNKSYIRELMLDGFDEIDADDTDFAFDCIKKIRNVFCDTRIWITSRPHMLPELEIRLETLGYHITAFTKEDQIYFLSSFWSLRIKGCDKTVISNFASQCLETLENKLGRPEEDIAGIPLQCFLVAEVFEEDAKRFLKSFSKGKFSYQQIASITDLYRKLIEKNINAFRGKNNFSTSAILKAHMHLAMEVMYPLHVNKFLKFLHHNMSRQEIFDVGLVEATSILSTPTFLHRTLAEYFVALFVSDSLIKHPTKMIYDFLFSDIMITRKDKICIYKYTAWQGKQNLLSRNDFYEICIPYQSFEQYVSCFFLNTFIAEASCNHLDIYNTDFKILCNIADACVYHNLTNLFNKFVLDDIRKMDVINETLLTKAVYMADVYFLNIISREYLLTNSTPITKIIVYTFDDFGDRPPYFHDKEGAESVERIQSDYGTTITLLHLAVLKADYATVDYLISNYFRVAIEKNERNVYGNVIHFLLKNSIDNTKWIVADKILIFNCLSSINFDLFSLENQSEQLPLEVQKPHLDLVIEVWKLSNKIYMKRNVLFSVLFNSDLRMPVQSWLTLLKAVFEKMEKKLVNDLVFDICTSNNVNLLVWIFERDELTTDFLTFMKKKGIFSSVTTKCRMALYEESLRKKDHCTLQFLLDHLEYTNEEIKVSLSNILDTGKFKHVSILLDYLNKCKPTDDFTIFCETFLFVFNDKTLTSYVNLRRIAILTCYFVWKRFSEKIDKTKENIDSETLVESGLTFLNTLVVRNHITKFQGCIIKLVWVAYIYASLENQIFIDKFEFYIKTENINLKENDTSGNNLLHIFAPCFNLMRLTNASSKKTCLNIIELFTTMHIFRLHFPAIDIWKLLVKHQINILQCNDEQQTPICLLRYFMDKESIADAILFAGQFLTAHKNFNIEDLHLMFYFVIKSHSLKVVRLVHDWYASFCKSRDILLENVKTTHNGSVCNFLDAAVQSCKGDIVEFVKNVLKIRLPLLPPSFTCLHQSIYVGLPYFDEKQPGVYIQNMAALFPKEICQLVNHPNEKNTVPLSVAGITSDVVSLLYKLGANINCKDDQGNTPLHCVMKGFEPQLHLVKEFIKCGADVNAQNFNKATPFSILVQRYSFADTVFGELHIQIFEMLINYNADPSIKDDEGNTILHHLVQNTFLKGNFHKIVKTLLAHGLGYVLNIPNDLGQTPLQLANKYLIIYKNTRELLKENNILELETTNLS